MRFLGKEKREVERSRERGGVTMPSSKEEKIGGSDQKRR